MKIKPPPLKAKHLYVRSKPEDGTIWITHEPNLRGPIRPVKDITNEILIALCAELNADGVTRVVERSVKFNDGFECRITVEMIKDADPVVASDSDTSG